jgi:hypothetical protein
LLLESDHRYSLKVTEIGATVVPQRWYRNPYRPLARVSIEPADTGSFVQIVFFAPGALLVLPFLSVFGALAIRAAAHGAQWPLVWHMLIPVVTFPIIFYGSYVFERNAMLRDLRQIVSSSESGAGLNPM